MSMQRRRPRSGAPPRSARQSASDPDFAATHDGKTFQEFYGTGKRGRNAYGKCVSTKAREQKAKADEADKAEVAGVQERGQAVPAGRAPTRTSPRRTTASRSSEFYGTNHNQRNAFGKCVSGRSQTYVDPIS